MAVSAYEKEGGALRVPHNYSCFFPERKNGWNRSNLKMGRDYIVLVFTPCKQP